MSSEQEIENALRQSRLTTSAAQDRRILNDALGELSAPSPSRSSGSLSEEVTVEARFGIPRMAALTGVAALLLFGIVLWIAQPSDSWAQVVDAVRAKPWIHLAGKNPDGGEIESWFSLSKQMSASKSEQWVSFEDHRLRIQYGYNPDTKVLRRTPISESSRKDFRLFGKLFEELFRAGKTLNVDTTETEIELLEQKRRRVKEDGKSWIEYELTFSAPPMERKPQKGRMVFRVDPQTRLPVTWKVFLLNDKKQAMQFRFSFPKSGPTDIYALGVPRDAKLIDNVPADDVQRLIDGVTASAERFDDHFAINIISDPKAPWYRGTPFLIWRKGDGMRNEVGIAEPTATPVKPPTENTNQATWWKERLKQLWFVPFEVCDSKTYYHNEAKPDGWRGDAAHPITWKQKGWPKPKWMSRRQTPSHPRSSPLVFAYPEIQSAGPFELNTNPKEGPKQTVLLTIRNPTNEPNEVSEQRYWIDPQQSYLVRRTEQSTVRTEDGKSVRTVDYGIIVEETAKSPQGIWYPTRLRHIHPVPDEQGDTKTIENVTRHYLDFNVDLPASLFIPTARPTLK